MDGADVSAKGGMAAAATVDDESSSVIAMDVSCSSRLKRARSNSLKNESDSSSGPTNGNESGHQVKRSRTNGSPSNDSNTGEMTQHDRLLTLKKKAMSILEAQHDEVVRELYHVENGLYSEFLGVNMQRQGGYTHRTSSGLISTDLAALESFVAEHSLSATAVGATRFQRQRGSANACGGKNGKGTGLSRISRTLSDINGRIVERARRQVEELTEIQQSVGHSTAIAIVELKRAKAIVAAADAGRTLGDDADNVNSTGAVIGVNDTRLAEERIQREGEVLTRVSELKRHGCWSLKRLPKCEEPQRKKVLWDFLLEEAMWLSHDFKQERKWKKAAAKRLSRAVVRYHADLKSRDERQQREEVLRLRRLAKWVAGEVRQFWAQVSQLVRFKHIRKIEAKKQEVREKSLSMLVGATEKFSSMLAQNMNESFDGKMSLGSGSCSPKEGSTIVDELDEEFVLSDNDSYISDEATLDEEEQLLGGDGRGTDACPEVKEEVDALGAEATKPLQDIVSELYPGYVPSVTPSLVGSDNASGDDDDDDDDDGVVPEVSSELSSPVAMNIDGDTTTDIVDVNGGAVASDSDENNDDDVGLEMLLENSSRGSNALDPHTGNELDDAAAAAQTLQPTGYTLATTTVRTPVPFLLKHSLREYQHVGLDWLVTMYDKGLNGILADEMGLGKTIQSISLLAHLACERGIWGPHLIVVPTSVMINWELECKKWCPGFKILTYYGSTKERKMKRRGWTKENAFHICITSYKLAVQDQMALRRKKWIYLILDEAQNIKNFQSQRWQTLLNFSSKRRLLLTGTPLQNSLMELWSLMHFLMPHVFQSHAEFKEWFANPVSSMIDGSDQVNENLIRRLHKVLRPFLLRRLKSEVEKQMPGKFEHIVPCHLSKRQRFLYEDFMSRVKTRETLASGNYLSIINILMQLRKVCNHPDLFEPRSSVSPLQCAQFPFHVPSLVFRTLSQNERARSSAMSLASLCLIHYETAGWDIMRNRELDDGVLDACQLDRVRDLAVSKTQIMDLVSSDLPPFYTDCTYTSAHERLRDFRASRLEQMGKINELRALCSVAYGIGERRCVSIPVGAASTVIAASTEPRRYLEYTNSLRFAVSTVSERFAKMLPYIQRFSMYVPAVLSGGPVMSVSHPSPSEVWSDTRTRLTLARTLSLAEDVCHTTRQLALAQFPEKRLIEYDCGKLQVLANLLYTLKSGGHRCLIFTQMTRMLDVLEAFLNYHGHTYLRLDGSTGIEQRQILMERFNTNSKLFVFILSTRSGGVGVNLTGADTVIFYDSDWNPTMDAQAQDRCHRIGQTRDVHIYRLVSERTIEENILKKANQKRMLDAVVIGSGGFTTEFFKSTSIHDLFGADAVASETPVTTPTGRRTKRRATACSTPTSGMVDTEGVGQRELEAAMLEAEDEDDRQAAVALRSEQVADLEEFKEETANSDASEVEAAAKKKFELMEAEVAELESQLLGVQKYALRYLEDIEQIVNTGFVIEAVDAHAKAQQRALGQSLASHAEMTEAEAESNLARTSEAIRAGTSYMTTATATAPEDDCSDSIVAHQQHIDGMKEEACEPQLFYEGGLSAASGLHYASDVEVPYFAPPDPDDDSWYLDPAMYGLYGEHSIDSSLQLVPSVISRIYTKRRAHAGDVNVPDTAALRQKRERKLLRKQQRAEAIANAAIIEGRRNKKSDPGKKAAAARRKALKAAVSSMLGPPLSWISDEDFVLLDSVRRYTCHSTCNWELVASVVNSTVQLHGRYRSGMQCRARYLNVIVPREEGRAVLSGDEPDGLSPDERAIASRKQKLPHPVPKRSRAITVKQARLADAGQRMARTVHASHFASIRRVIQNRKSPRRSLSSSSVVGGHHASHDQAAEVAGVVPGKSLTPMHMASIIAEHAGNVDVNQHTRQDHHFGGAARGHAGQSASAASKLVMAQRFKVAQHQQSLLQQQQLMLRRASNSESNSSQTDQKSTPKKGKRIATSPTQKVRKKLKSSEGKSNEQLVQVQQLQQHHQPIRNQPVAGSGGGGQQVALGQKLRSFVEAYRNVIHSSPRITQALERIVVDPSSNEDSKIEYIKTLIIQEQQAQQQLGGSGTPINITPTMLQQATLKVQRTNMRVQQLTQEVTQFQMAMQQHANSVAQAQSFVQQLANQTTGGAESSLEHRQAISNLQESLRVHQVAQRKFQTGQQQLNQVRKIQQQQQQQLVLVTQRVRQQQQAQQKMSQQKMAQQQHMLIQQQQQQHQPPPPSHQ